MLSITSDPDCNRSRHQAIHVSLAALALALGLSPAVQAQEAPPTADASEEAFPFDLRASEANITGQVTQSVAGVEGAEPWDGEEGQSEALEEEGPPEPDAELPAIVWTDPPRSVPPALQDAVDIVTQTDPAVLASWWRVRAANSAVRAAWWQRFPSLTLDGNISTRSNWLLPSLTVDVPVWAGGRIDANRDRARIQESAAEAGWQEVVVDLALLVTDTYYYIVLNTQLESIYEDSLAAHRDLVETMERRVAQQISAQADLELAQSRTAQVEQQLNIIRSQREIALQTLAELVRDPGYELGSAPTFVHDNIAQDWSDAVPEAVEYSPARRRLSLDAETAEQDIRLARGALFPQISAQYAYNDVTGGRVGVGVRMETGNGLSRFSQIDEARARYQTAMNQTRLFERQLRQDIASEVTTNLAAISRAGVSLEAAMTAEWVSESYLRQFVAGRRSWLDVMNSLREDLTAKSSLVQAEVTAMVTSARLNIRTGRWRPVRTSGEE